MPRNVATPLPPRKFSQTGNRWPEKGAEGGDESEVAAEQAVGDNNRHGALEHIPYQRCGGEGLVAGAEHIGRADVAGADCADVAYAGEACEDEAEGDRAEQIAESEGGKEPREIGDIEHAQTYS